MEQKNGAKLKHDKQIKKQKTKKTKKQTHDVNNKSILNELGRERLKVYSVMRRARRKALSTPP